MQPADGLLLPGTMIVAAFSALSTAIVGMWLQFRSHYRENQRECRETKVELVNDIKRLEEKRERDQLELRAMAEKVGRIEGGKEGFISGVEAISQRVIDEVKGLKKEG